MKEKMTYKIKRTNKKNGITYIYEVNSYWDKEKKQARNKQICIGKMDPNTGGFIASKRFSPKETEKHFEVKATAEIVGPYMILDFFNKKIGLDKLLKKSFPVLYNQILTLVYYLSSNGRALSHCESWCKNHVTSFQKPLTSQRISEILKSITLKEKQSFLSSWMNKILENDYLCYDITSISSYSTLNEYVRYGYNRDKEKLPQINLAMLFGQKCHLPVYYSQIPGNITDVTTLNNILKTFKAINIKHLNCIMDKGFYSKKNIEALLKSRNKFTLSVPINNNIIKKAIDDIYDVIHGPKGYRKVDNGTVSS